MAKPKFPSAKKSIINPIENQVITMPDAGAVPVKRSPTSVSSLPVSFSAPDLESKIRERAYELHALRGYISGFDQEDWFEAERQILGRAEKRKMQSA